MLELQRSEPQTPHPAIVLAGQDLTSGETTWTAEPHVGETTFSGGGARWDTDYMHARYYKPIWGRFLSVDPARRSARLSNPQSWNRYAYAAGNPVNVVDLNGKWPTHVRHVHQGSIDRSLPNVSASDRAILKQQQVVMDFDQSTEGSFKHAMRAFGRESVADARQKANDFVRKNLLDARKYEAEGKHELAVSLVGRAMHTVQDSTSPKHGGFLPWDGSWGKADPNTASHVAGEFYDPGAGSALDNATKTIWNLFQSDEELPADFFNDNEAAPATTSCDSNQSSCPK